MIFTKTEVEGAYIIERTPFKDDRGYFARLYCEREFAEHGLETHFVQINLSQNKEKGTLRGLHYQVEKPEDKMVSCTRGKVWDVCVDIRKDSPTFLKYVGVELSEENGRMLYVPKGCAHGYLTLEDDSQVLYLVTEFFAPNLDSGYRYDDPAFGIQWPTEVKVVSQKDQNAPYMVLDGEQK